MIVGWSGAGTPLHGGCEGVDSVAALEGVLQQYERQGRLLQEVLTARQLANEREQHLDTALKHLRAYAWHYKNSPSLIHSLVHKYFFSFIHDRVRGRKGRD
jgi:hypothetical protein